MAGIDKNGKKALIAMSGGVDSSVAAFLCCDAGYDCIGATMKLYDNGDIGESNEKSCCSLSDVEDARSVAFRLGMPYYVFNFKEDFENTVINNFIDCYLCGKTPNPCIECNRHLKFSRLMRRAQELAIDYVVTGHYARIERDMKTGRFLLLKAVDDTKDQSYVLYSMTQFELEHTLFPLGSLTKTEARKIAETQGFRNAKKHDSQDICFVPDGDYAAFIKMRTGKGFQKGDFVDMSGKKVGEHNGIACYTIGQRKGLGIALNRPVYVVNIDVENNTITLGDECDLYSNGCVAENINLISVEKIDKEMKLCAKTRYSALEKPCVVSQDGDRLKILFDTPQRAVTKGQAVVLYDGDIVVGGGTISEVIK